MTRFVSGITVVTTKDRSGKFHGITVSAFCSVSLEPPLVLICIEKTTGSHYAFGESGVFAVNFLPAGQASISEWFASQSEDKFKNVNYTIGSLGVPLIKGCLANIECTIERTCDGGDHSIIVGRVDEATVNDGDPLIYFRGEYRRYPMADDG